MKLSTLLVGVPTLVAAFGQVKVESPVVTGVVATQSKEGTAAKVATATQMEAGLMNEGVVTFANPNDHTWHCVDGRSTEPVFGTAGGDAGEFLAALSAIYPYASDEMKAKPIGELTADLFAKFVDTEVSEERPFYLHTDQVSTDKAKESLECDDDGCVLFFPDPDDEDKLAGMVSNSMYMGCGHLKYMLEKPGLYNTDPKMVVALVQSFFRYAWTHKDSAKMKFDVHDHDNGATSHYEQAGHALVVDLPGFHEEQAVFGVNSDNAELTGDEDCVAPMVKPSFNDPDTGDYTQYFVSHSLGGTITGLRHKNARFMMNQLGVQMDEQAVYDLIQKWSRDSDEADRALESLEAKNMAGEVRQTATDDLLATVGLLAADLPIITADIESTQPAGSPPRC